MKRMAERIELQGHRGARGDLPENSLLGFEAALTMGTDGIELDIAMSRDGVLIVTHDAALNPDIVRHDGSWIRESIPVKSLTVTELQSYDVGRLRPSSELAQRFSRQKPIDGVRMPLLAEVMDLPEVRAMPGASLDIEIKTSPLDEHATFPPHEIAAVLAETINRVGMRASCRIRSFDWRALAAFRALEPDIPVACLTATQPWLNNIASTVTGASPWLAGIVIEECGGSVARAVHSFGSEVWAPYYSDITQNELDLAHELGLRVIVWTVNAEPAMRNVLSMGVDGITTDYPEIGRRVIDAMMNDE
jgi:glycerophosphoryl diester phosphodiesterase